MPCPPGMVGCRADCGHRRFVLDYVALRDAQLDRAEAVTKGHDTETASYFGTDGEGDAVEERWTFQRHLISYAGDDYPYPRSDRDAPDPDRADEVGGAADR